MSYKELVWELTGCLCRALVGQTLQVPKTETRKLNQEKYGTYVFLLTCKAKCFSGKKNFVAVLKKTGFFFSYFGKIRNKTYSFWVTFRCILKCFSIDT